MNAIVKSEPKLMLLDHMADKYGLTPEEFSRTVRHVCGIPKATPEEFAGFLIVCRNYNLNPILKEIYGFPARGGGIIPIVGIDGWIHMVNDHPQCDGFTFSFEHDDQNKLVSCTCTIYRKDRTHPTVVTEYFSECYRPTDAWKSMGHRMMRHKALMQGARYAFGFAGIYDEDEGRTIAEAKGAPPIPQEFPKERLEIVTDAEHTEVASDDLPVSHAQGGAAAVTAPQPLDSGAAHSPQETASDILQRLEETLCTASTLDEVDEFYDEIDAEAYLTGISAGDSVETARMIRDRHVIRVTLQAPTEAQDAQEASPATTLPATPPEAPAQAPEPEKQPSNMALPALPPGGQFETGQDYSTFITDLIASIHDKKTAYKAVDLWKATGDERNRLGMKMAARNELRGRLTETLNKFLGEP